MSLRGQRQAFGYAIAQKKLSARQSAQLFRSPRNSVATRFFS
jgi:hypothetical protein